MFLGEYEYKIDEKGRIPLPPKFREQLREGLILSQGLEKCITAYPIPEWKKIAEKLSTLPPTRNKERRMNRFIFATAFDIEIDGQGRVMLPLPLRQHAEIKDSVIIAGLNNHFEIWSKENWEQEKALIVAEAWQISEGMAR